VAVFYSNEALEDLNGIDEFLSDVSPAGLRNVFNSIKNLVERIEAHPKIGRPVRGESIRVIVETKCQYIVAYGLKGNHVWILRVYHTRRMPLNFAELSLP
jgi:plasmid stabilization system protein ParE